MRHQQRDGRQKLVAVLVLWFLLACLPQSVSAVPLSFDTSFLSVSSVYASPKSLAIADVNRDGYPDLIGVDRFGNSMVILLNAGDGTFPPAEIPYDTAQQPSDVAVADLNRDGNPDLGISNYGSNTVSVYLGNGDGTFTLKSNFQPSGVMKATSLAYGELNGDSILDVVVTGLQDNVVAVAFGNGDGTFGARIDYPAGEEPEEVALGDFNNDGRLDIVTINRTGHSFSIFLNDGDGTFAPRADTWLGTLGGLAVSDLDGDGNQDLVISNIGGYDQVYVLWGNGNGTFQPHADYVPGGDPLSLSVADVDGDGRLDIVTGNSDTDSFTILFGMPGRQFGNRVDWKTGNYPLDIAVADLNLDGWPDLAAATSMAMSVSLNRGDGTFGGRERLATTHLPYCVTSTDLNQDRRSDIIVGTESSVSVFLGQPDGSYDKRGDYGVGAWSLATGDFNEDGIIDVLASTGIENTASILLGNGDGSLGTPIDFTTGSNTYCVLAWDLNYDRHLDFVVVNKGSNTVSVMYGDGTGTQFERVDYTTYSSPTCAAVGDVNGDGVPDLVVGNSGYRAPISVFPGRGELGFGTRADYPAGVYPESLALGDLNGDGKLDIAVTNMAEGSVSVHLGTGTGAFPSFTKYYLPLGMASGMAVGDVDGDGFLDLVSGRSTPSCGYVTVLLGNGDGTFGQRIDYGTGMEPQSLCLRDLNGDHALDIVTANRYDDTVSILTNISGRTKSSAPEPGNGGSQPPVLLLSQSYPNPFQRSTTLTYSLAAPVLVRLSIYDLLGRLMLRREEGSRPAGSYTLTWDGRNDQGKVAGPGTYFLRLEAAGQAQTRKMIITR